MREYEVLGDKSGKRNYFGRIMLSVPTRRSAKDII